MNEITVFVASPGDLEEERIIVRSVIGELNTGFGDGRGVKFIFSGWEDVPSSVGVRSQSVINKSVDKCDVFVLMLHVKWGQDASDSEYSSYTEEEFHRALDRYKQTKSPCIFVFFKTVNPVQEADPGPQLKKVIEFKKSLQASKIVIYKSFDSSDQIGSLIDGHLRSYARGDIHRIDVESFSTPLPLSAMEEISRLKKEASAALRSANDSNRDLSESLSRSSDLTLLLAEKATNEAIEGNAEEARLLFAKVVSGSANVAAYHSAIQFYIKTGDLSAANFVLDKLEPVLDFDSQERVRIKLSRGSILSMRGEYSSAEKEMRVAVSLARSTENRELLGDSLSSLGTELGYQSKNEEAMVAYSEALSIFEEIPVHDKVAATKNSYAGMSIYTENYDVGKQYAKDALAYYEKAKITSGIEDVYGNMGLMYWRDSDHVNAVDMFEKALAIHHIRDDKAGLLNDYRNIGKICSQIGEHERSIEMYENSLSLSQKMGRIPCIIVNLGQLGVEYMHVNNIPAAKMCFEEAISYNETNGVDSAMEAIKANLEEIHRIDS